MAMKSDHLPGSQQQFQFCSVNCASERTHHCRGLWPSATFAAGLLILVGCSVVPGENATEPAAPANYGVLISNNLKSFKSFSSYSNFEISGLRWVHAATGWSWLACVRYDDHGHRRTYAFFIRDNALADARYEVASDQCGLQQYLPFDVATGTIRSATPEAPSPLY